MAGDGKSEALKRQGLDWTGAIKWAAIASMVIDHVGHFFRPDVFALRVVGRVAFPAFAFLVAYNAAFRSRDEWRFMSRLWLWGLLSLPVTVALGIGPFNILFTLALGLAVVMPPAPFQLCIPGFLFGLWLAGDSLPVHYGTLGVLLVATLRWSLPMFLDATPNRCMHPRPRYGWFWYAFYPGHLFVVLCIKAVMA